MTLKVTFITLAATSASGDFDLQSMNITFPVGSANRAVRCVTLTVNSDNLVESEEDFTVMLTLVTSGANLNLGNSVFAVTLGDSDGM